MNPVGQWSDSGSNSRLVTIAVPVGLIVFASLMVLLNAGELSPAAWLIPLALLGILLVAAWRTAPIISLAGLALVTLVWALAELPGSPGILMIAPLGWLWVGRAHPLSHCLLASAFAIVVAATEGTIALVSNSGTAVDLVGNTALGVVIVLVGAKLRQLGWTGDDHIVDGNTVDKDEPAAKVNPAPAWLEHLSRREREVLAQLVDGASNNEIAANLHISLSTVKTHVSSILRKADAQSRYAVALELRPGPATAIDAPRQAKAN